jgi:hypothetical protein
MSVKVGPPAKIWLPCRSFSVIILFLFHSSIWRGSSMKINKSAFFLLLLLFAIFSLNQVFAASSVKTVAIKVPFPDVGG